MGYEEKIQMVQTIIEQHNTALGLEQAGGVNLTIFLEALKLAGGTSDEGLKACSWEDLQRMGLPVLLARQVARVFREEPSTPAPEVITPKKALGMTVAQLFAAYDLRDAENAVGKRLAELAKSKRCVVFKDDGSVDAVQSGWILDELRNGDPEREFFGTPPRKTYRIGERPVEMADENPLYRGRALRRDGTCDQTNRSWDGVHFEVRALLYIAVHETHEVEVRSLDDAHNLLDRAIVDGKKEESDLRRRYPRASVMFDELKAQGKAPQLKVPRGNSGRAENPFGTNRRY